MMQQTGPQTDFLKAAVTGDTVTIAAFFDDFSNIGADFQAIARDLGNLPKANQNLQKITTHMRQVARNFETAAHVDPSLYKSIMHDLTIGLAAFYGHEELYLQSAPHAPASPPGDVYMFMHLASDGGNYNILADMSKRHNLPIDFDDNTALLKAISRDDIEMVQKLCENHSLNPSKPCPLSKTAQFQIGTEKADALYHAVHASRHNIATYLMQSQDVDPLANNGAALTAAQLYKRPHMLDEMLLQHIDIIPANCAFNFFQYLAEEGDIRRLNQLHEDEQINLQDHAQALFEGAFSKGNIHIIEYITQFVDPNLSDLPERSWQMLQSQYNRHTTKGNNFKRCVIFAQICGADTKPFEKIDPEGYADIMQAYQKTMQEHEDSLQKTWHQVNRTTLKEQSHKNKLPMRRRPKTPKR